MDHELDDDGDSEGDGPIAIPPDAAGYLALLDEHGWFEDLPPAYVEQARKGVEAAYARGDHPATGLAIHSVLHSEDAEPQWFGALLNDVVSRSHGLLKLENARVQKNKRGDYVAKAKAGSTDLQETIYDAKDEGAQDPILGVAVLLEQALETLELQEVNFGYFTDEKKVLHWYLRPRDLPFPRGLIPDDLEDLEPEGLDEDLDDEAEDEDEVAEAGDAGDDGAEGR